MRGTFSTGCYLSKIERDRMAPPSEAVIRRLAAELDEDPDLLLAMAGKVSSDLKEIILKRPRLFAELLRQTKDAPEDAILRVVREVRDFQEVPARTGRRRSVGRWLRTGGGSGGSERSVCGGGGGRPWSVRSHAVTRRVRSGRCICAVG